MIDFATYNLNDPSQRKQILKNIRPERAAVRPLHHDILDLFRREMEWRRGDEEDDDNYFEQVYWCALLLYLIGDPADVPLMWEAKHIDMDTGCGFDGQTFVGAGVERTIAYLKANDHLDIAEYIEQLRDCGDLDHLAEWKNWRIKYYYEDSPFTSDTH